MKKVILFLRRLWYRMFWYVGHLAWRLLGFRLRSVRAEISCGDEILMIRHTYGDRQKWSNPGGLVNWHEDPVRAIAREVREEVGLDLPPSAFELVDTEVEQYGRGQATHYIYRASISPEQKPDVTIEAGEIAEAKWMKK